MSIGVEEDARVAAPERLGAAPADRRARRLGLREYSIDLGGRADVVGERDPAPAAGILDGRVLREAAAVPERDDRPSRPEEDDVVLRGGAARPAEGLVEAARPGEVADAEGDQAQP